MTNKNKMTMLTIITIISSAIAGGAIGLSPVIARYCHQYLMQRQPRFQGLEEYMKKNSYGTPITLPVEKDTPIKVDLKNFTDAEIQDMKNAINDLDEISENINYTILDNSDLKVEQKIVVQKISHADMTQIMHDANIGGYVVSKIDDVKASIQYPINIYISDICEGVSTNGKTLMSYVIKHEMMHALGFADLKDDKYLGKSIMYYNASENTIEDFSDLDRAHIKQLYDYNIEDTIKKVENGMILVQTPYFLTNTYVDEKDKIKENDDQFEY